MTKVQVAANKKGFQPETVIKGLSLSAGIAVARVCRFNEARHSNLEVYKVSGEGVEREIDRIKKAVALVVERIEVLRQETESKIGKAEAEIFTAHRMILEDPALIKKIEGLIRDEHTNAEAAVMVVMDSYEARMRQIDSEFLNDRAGDFVEIKNRLLDVLRDINPVFQCADSSHCQRGRNRIVVASELTPGMTVELDTAHTLGFVTERGGANSHAAILARAMGIPAVSGIPDIFKSISCGTEIAVDGNSGEVIIWPTEKTIARLKKASGGVLRAPGRIEPVAGFKVMANINTSCEIDEAVEMNCEGIGLYRTEFEFMTAGRFLDENEQYQKYSHAVKAMEGRPVTFRLFDAGGDKPLPFLDIVQEENPALGWRGGRLLLGHSVLMRTQARAIVRASEYGPVRVLYPMIVDLAQYRKLRKVFNESVEGLDVKNVEHGVMFEVPSACMDAGRLMKESDFASIGTNDLIQYLFAVDRNNARVAYDYSPDRAIFWKVVKNISRAAMREGKKLSVCGEIAGDPRYINRLMKSGIFAVSVSSRLISGARVAAMEILNRKQTKETK